MLCDHPVIQNSPNSAATQDLHYVMPHQPGPNAEPAQACLLLQTCSQHHNLDSLKLQGENVRFEVFVNIRFISCLLGLSHFSQTAVLYSNIIALLCLFNIYRMDGQLEFYLHLVNSQICGYSSYLSYPDILVTSCLKYVMECWLGTVILYHFSDEGLLAFRKEHSI